MAKKKQKIVKQPAGRPLPSKVFNPPQIERSVLGRSILAPSGAVPPEDRNVVYVQTIPAGSSGVRIYGGYFSEEYLINELHGTAAADEYDRMRRSDAKMKMALNAVKTPIIAANWEVQPASDDKDHKLHAEFINHVLFKDMDRPFSKTETLSHVDFGHAVFEITHKPVLGHPVFGDYVGLAALGWRSPRSILSWHLNPKNGNIDHIKQLISGDLERFVDIPGQFLLVSSLEKEGDLYEGVSLMRAAYGAWKRKNLYLKLMAIGNERNAVPTPTAEIPIGKQNSVEYQNLIAALQNYTSHQNSYLTYPEGWKIDFMKSNFDPEKLKLAIEFENSEMVSAFMANFLLLGSSQTGSRAVSMDQSEFFLGAIQYIGDEAIAPHNHKLIPELVKMKYGPQEAYPFIKISGISDKAGVELSTSLKNLAETQWIQPDDPSEENLRRRYGLPKKSDQGVRIVQAPKAMQQGDNVITTDHPEQVQEKERNVDAAEIADRVAQRILLSSSRLLAKRAKKAKAHIPEAREELKALMKGKLEGIASQMVLDIMAAKKRLPESKRREATSKVEPKGVQSYRADLKATLSDIALKAQAHARAEIPEKKAIRLYAEEPSIKLAAFDQLPLAVQARILEQANLVVDTQIADLKKGLFFQFGHSVDSTGDDDVLEKDLEGAAETYIEGPSLGLGAANTASSIVNESRNAFFFDDDVMQSIQAMQFVNGDPQCPICQDLNGSTFDPEDPEAERYYPPLHHHCDCILVPILVGEKEVDITGLKPSKADLEDYITFSEKKHLLTRRDWMRSATRGLAQSGIRP